MENNPNKTNESSSRKWIQQLESLEEIVFNLTEENIYESVDPIINLLNDDAYPFPKLALSRIIYSAFQSKMNDYNIYINFLKQIETKEKENNKTDYEMLNTFTKFLQHLDTQESYFLLDRMIKINLIPANFIDDKITFYFANYISDKKMENLKKILERDWKILFSTYFMSNYENLSKNDWELHKQLVEEGINPNEIAIIIRNDNVEKLREITSQTKFIFNQIIVPSLYEKCSFINKPNVSLIDYAAFFGSIKCFKYLLLNGFLLKQTAKFAVAGGNLEIIHICEQNKASFEGAYEAAIEFIEMIFFIIYMKIKLLIFQGKNL